MATKNKVTTSQRPQAQRPSPAERRAAQTETLSRKQAELKQEAAERRKAREAKQEKSTPSPPRRARGRAR
jgi:hypothetical protein